jgi:hypothetical protein
VFFLVRFYPCGLLDTGFYLYIEPQNLSVIQILQTNLTQRLPTFGEMVTYYGPYLGLVLSLIIVILILQYRWFGKIIGAKNEEIKRLVEREEQLNARVLHMISEEIGYKKKKEIK